MGAKEEFLSDGWDWSDDAYSSDEVGWSDGSNWLMSKFDHPKIK